MTAKIQIIDFHGQTLLTLEQDGKHYVAMKPICENIGLDWEAQRQRIQRNEVLAEATCMIKAPSKGGEQTMLCLPIEYLNGWLFGVDASRVNPEIKDAVILYQKECYQVLNDYWRTGAAINPRLSTVKEREALNSAIKRLAKMANIDYSTAYKMVWERYGIKNAESLPVEMIPEVLEYVHGLILKAAAAATEEKETDYLSTQDREVITQLVQLVANGFFYEGVAKHAIWAQLRHVTNKRTASFLTKGDLPIIAKEFERLLRRVDSILHFRRKADMLLAKQMISEEALEVVTEMWLRAMEDQKQGLLNPFAEKLLESLI